MKTEEMLDFYRNIIYVQVFNQEAA